MLPSNTKMYGGNGFQKANIDTEPIYNACNAYDTRALKDLKPKPKNISRAAVESSKEGTNIYSKLLGNLTYRNI